MLRCCALFVVPCFAMLCNAVLYCAMLCYVALCCAMLCYVVLLFCRALYVVCLFVYFFIYNNFICNNNQYKKAGMREELNPHVR